MGRSKVTVRIVAPVAMAAMAVAFVVDALTPQSLIVASLFAIPVALAALTPSRRLTKTLAVAAVVLDVLAAVINAYQAHRWDTIALENRLFVIVSIVVVGLLTLALQVRNENLRLNSVMQELVSAIAHDVRNPLAALSMTLGQAADGVFGALPPRYADVLRDSRVSIDDLQRLAETLLLVARYESAPKERLRESVDVASTVRELLSEFHAMASARGVNLARNATLDVPAYALAVSRGDIRRAVANLIANALANTPRGGSVEVRVDEERDHLLLVVADNGFGIDESFERTLFEESSRGGNGQIASGLGLYIVRRVAEDSGGTIAYERCLPRGSRFTLSLPRSV